VIIHMPVEAAIYLKRYDFKRSVKQVLWRPMALLVTLCCLTVTYDRAGFTYKSEKSCAKILRISGGGELRTHPTHLACLGRWLQVYSLILFVAVGYTIRYHSVYLTCSQKLTGCKLRIKQKNLNENRTKEKVY